ncbi:MAG: PAS domain S-box protein [Thermoplasmata archaeon]
MAVKYEGRKHGPADQFEGMPGVGKERPPHMGISPNTIFAIDRNLKITFVNQAQPGYAKDQIIGSNITDFVLPEHQETMRRSIEQVLRTGKPAKYETVVDGPRESHSSYATLVSPIKHDERIIGAMLVTNDITEHRTSEKVSRVAKERWTSLVGNTDDIIMIVDSNAVIQYANKTIPPLTLEKAIGKEVYDYIPRKQHNVLRESLRAVFAMGKSERFEVSTKAPKVGTIWFDTELVPIQRNGRVVSVILVATDVTERKRIEDELRASEERYRSTIEAAPDGIVTLNLKGIVTSCNRGFAEMSGFSREEIIGRHFTKLPTLRKRDAPRHLKIFASMLRGKSPKPLEVVWIDKEGNKRFAEISLGVMRKGGKISGFQAIARDLTDRSEMREALRESEARFRAIFNEAGIGIAQVKEDGRPVVSNAALQEMLGYSGEELSNMVFTEFTHPDDVETDWKLSQELFAGKRDHYQMEKRFVRKDGRLVWGRLTSSLVRNARGKPQFGIGMVEDITERKRAEEGLRKSQQELSLRNRINEIFLAIPDDQMYGEALQVVLSEMKSEFGIFGYINDDGDLVSASMTKDVWEKCQVPDKQLVFPREAWGGVWGHSLKEKKAIRSNGPLHVPEGHISIKAVVSVPITHGEEVIGILMVANKEGGYDERDQALVETIARNLSPVLHARLQRDSQERKRRQAEDELKQTLEELARSNQELEQFAYVASHDLQEPLRTVSSYVQLLKRRYRDKLDSDADEFIEYASDGASRMQTMINDLLMYSRVGTRGKEFSPVDCNSALDRAKASLELMIEENEAVITQDSLPTVAGDDSQLTQLFQNLIGNSIKFRGEGPPRIDLSAEQEGDEWVFSVQDNGIGIEHQYSERIFEVFQRLHSRAKYSGSGIGLAICKKIIERHGGRIWVESEPGRGSTFYFTIPVARDDSYRKDIGGEEA